MTGSSHPQQGAPGGTSPAPAAQCQQGFVLVLRTRPQFLSNLRWPRGSGGLRGAAGLATSRAGGSESQPGPSPRALLHLNCLHFGVLLLPPPHTPPTPQKLPHSGRGGSGRAGAAPSPPDPPLTPSHLRSRRNPFGVPLPQADSSSRGVTSL